MPVNVVPESAKRGDKESRRQERFIGVGQVGTI